MIRSLQDLIVQHRASINAQNKQSGKGLSLRQGDIVKGKVLDFHHSGRAKLLVQGKELTAQTSVKLAKGQTAQFRVEQTQPQYIFKVFDASNIQQSMLKLFGSSAMQASPFQLFQNLFQSLKNNSELANQKQMLQMMHLFSQLSIKPGDSITPYFLMAFLQRSGLMWENKLKQWVSSQKNLSSDRLKKMTQQDLKALTLEALQNIDDDHLDIKLSLEQMVEQFEQWQMLNHKTLTEHGKLYFMLPLQFDNLFYTGELLIDISDMKKGGKEASVSMLKASLLLKMSRIGPVKIDATLLQRQLRIEYWLSQQETIDLFKSYESTLSEALAIHGIFIQLSQYYLKNEQELNEMSLLHDISRSGKHLSTFA
jgi:hypothetical protein